ncbi:MAG: class I SAM-dependent methyltransferase [Bacteroidetes bacterium]|nr:class I SAM-dependent methyltransferase [Bacteroidota bacterium]
MKEKFVALLRNPNTGNSFILKDTVKEIDRIKSGKLVDSQTGDSFPIIDYIPRFVPIDNYAKNFGLEWNIHNKTQFDETSKHSISEKRLFKETKWDRNLEGALILEAGSGSGRFTEHLVKTGATVVSFDYSSAVEANYKSNYGNDNLLLVQADIFNMPLKDATFDKVLCIGVLQHTPDPEQAFYALEKKMKPKGNLVTDIYLKNIKKCVLSPKYYLRTITRKMEPKKLYKITTAYIDFMWPLARIISRIPVLGKKLNWFLMIADYSRLLLSADSNTLKQWAYLDTFDMLSPLYDKPVTIKTFKSWHEKAGLIDIDVCYGYNGIEGRAKKRP